MRHQTSNPKFSNFKLFCTKAINDILAQPGMQGLQLECHLEMLASHLMAATARTNIRREKVATAEKLLAFDLANFSLQEKWIPEPSDLNSYTRLRVYMPFVCDVAKGEGNFIREFIANRKLEISPENFAAYETRFKESTAQLLEKTSRYVMQCSDICDSSYHNYFDEIRRLQSPTEELSVIETIKSKSLLYRIKNPETKRRDSTPVNISGKETPVNDLLETLSAFSVSPSPKKAAAKEPGDADLSQISISFAGEISPATEGVKTRSAFQAVKKKGKVVSFGGEL